MKYKSIIISILVLVGVSCKTQKFIPPPQPIKLSDSYNPYGTSIEAFKKYYFIGLKNQVLKRNLERDSISNNFYHTNGTPLNNTTISNFTSKKSGYLYERVLIKNGYPQSVYYAKAGVNDTVKTYTYKKGNISGYYIVKNLKDSILYKTSFKRGNGYWKDYYYKINKLREEQIQWMFVFRIVFLIKKNRVIRSVPKGKMHINVGIDEIYKYYY